MKFESFVLRTLLTGIKELVDLFRPKREWAGGGYELIIMESDNTILFPLLLLVLFTCLHMDPYAITFYLGLGIGVIGPAFDISIVIWVPYLLLWASIESRNRFDCTSF